MANNLPRGLRNNNPGNIRLTPDKWQGEVPSKDKAFKAFESMAWGYRAIFMLLDNYQRKYRCRTITDMVNRWAPPNENHTPAYIGSVAKWSGVDPKVGITTTNRDVMVPIVAAMSQVENGVPAVMGDVIAGWDLFIAKK